MDLRLQQEKFAGSFGLTYDSLHKLMKTLSTTDLMTCLDLLKTKTFRSSFRKNCSQQLRSWLDSDAPFRLTPLSRYQLDMLKPKWPIDIQIPCIGINNDYDRK